MNMITITANLFLYHSLFINSTPSNKNNILITKCTRCLFAYSIAIIIISRKKKICLFEFFIGCGDQPIIFSTFKNVTNTSSNRYEASNKSLFYRRNVFCHLKYPIAPNYESGRGGGWYQQLDIMIQCLERYRLSQIYLTFIWFISGIYSFIFSIYAKWLQVEFLSLKQPEGKLTKVSIKLQNWNSDLFRVT